VEETRLLPSELVGENLEEIAADDSKEETMFLIGASLTYQEKRELTILLRNNIGVFAWEPYELPGIDPSVVCHWLHVDPTFRPVTQKARRTAPEKAKAVEKEVEKLLDAGSIREIQFPKWLSNPVVVPKSNGKWRVCIDFTDLNRACPKESFPLPKIDQLVDARAAHERMRFLDAYSGYQQIPLYTPDQDKTAFITTVVLY